MSASGSFKTWITPKLLTGRDCLKKRRVGLTYLFTYRLSTEANWYLNRLSILEIPVVLPSVSTNIWSYFAL